MNAIDRSLGSTKPLTLYGVEVTSRLLLGTARYPSPQVMSEAAKAARTGILTVSVAVSEPKPAEKRVQVQSAS